jgi:hypothetical protein
VRNEEERVCSVCLFRCNIFIGFRIIKEMPGSVASGTPCRLYIFVTTVGCVCLEERALFLIGHRAVLSFLEVQILRFLCCCFFHSVDYFLFI